MNRSTRNALIRATGPVTVDWQAAGWHRKDPRWPLLTRTWMDPCPVCGQPVTGFHAEAVTVTDNPYSVISIRNPACQWDERDPDSPDCICTAVINPAPSPLFDQVHVVGYRYWLRPCDHEVAKITLHSQEVPEPGTLAALMIAAYDTLEREDPTP